MSLKRLIPSSIFAILTLGIGYILFAFVTPGIFTLKVLGPIGLAFLLMAIAGIVSLPSAETYLKQKKNLSSTYYWIAVGLPALISLGLTLAAIIIGSAEYTEFQASVS